jgi:hypothetical protein
MPVARTGLKWSHARGRRQSDRRSRTRRLGVFGVLIGYARAAAIDRIRALGRSITSGDGISRPLDVRIATVT